MTLSEVVKACTDHARDLIDSAVVVEKSGKPNIAYHLATLAIEELGRRELILMDSMASQQPNSPSWLMKHTQDHEKKIFWAFFGASFYTESLTKHGIESIQGLAEFIHSMRLAGLYVDVGEDGLNVPSEAIPPDMCRNLIDLATAQLGMVEGLELKTDLPDEDRENINWLMAAVTDDTKQKYIFAKASLDKLAELKDPRGWIRWLREQFTDAEAKALEIAKKEIERSRNLPSERTRDKWKIRLRFHSASHSVRQKELNKWNAGDGWIKLLAVPEKKGQLIVEFILGDNVPVTALWQPGWIFARQFAVALNMATRGFWWWHLPNQTSKYYETIVDLEQNNAEIVVTSGPEMKINWGENLVLRESDLGLAFMCMGAVQRFPQKFTMTPLDYYHAGLNFLSFIDIHWPGEADVYGNFHESLKAFMACTGDMKEGEPFTDALSRFLEGLQPAMSPEVRGRYIDIARDHEKGAPFAGLVNLSDVAAIKVLCDTYFIQRVGPIFWEKPDQQAPESASS